MSSRNGNGRRCRRLGIAVVGLGYWGPNLVRNLYELPEAELVAVCDMRADAVAAIRRRYPAIEGRSRLEDVLGDPRVDAVAIATPVATHYQLALSALLAGKHVFVEKPLAASAVAAGDLLALARERELVLMPGHTFLYSPPVNKIRELIRSGELGEVYFVSASRVNLGLHQPDVSVAWDLGPHDFSILRYWLDETPTHLAATSRACVLPGTPDVVFVNMEYRSGAIAHVELSWLAPSKLRRTTVVGSQKMVVYDDTSGESVRIFDSGVLLGNPTSFGEWQLSYRTGDIVSPKLEVAEPLSLELRDFCRAIRRRAAPRSSAALGVEVVRLIEAVDRSLARDGARVEVGTEATAAVVA
ncbi:MAG TPA: Gfo/Idh/MocA family oxidoreductase [Gaiellaceae bacterium]|nr:Gfo/Idh/MocA family oxidoreductase [Gaiellaceae bacterium]